MIAKKRITSLLLCLFTVCLSSVVVPAQAQTVACFTMDDVTDDPISAREGVTDKGFGSPPVANLSVNNQQLPRTIVLDARCSQLVTNIDVSDYQWVSADGQTRLIAGPVVTFVYNQEGVFPISLRVQDGGPTGPEDTTFRTLTIGSSPQGGNERTTLGPGRQFTFTANGTLDDIAADFSGFSGNVLIDEVVTSTVNVNASTVLEIGISRPDPTQPTDPTPTPTPQPCLTTDINPGQMVSGSWASDCTAANRADRFARYYTFNLPSTQLVTIDLTSAQDTFLNLLNGADNTGTVIESNDDGGDGLNSRIIRTLDAGTYTIEATTFSAAATGNFDLLLSADPCRSLLPLNQATSGSWASNCTSVNRTGRFARYYTFSLASTQQVSIDLTSTQDTFLFLLNGAGNTGTVIESNDDGGTGLNSRITTTLDAGTYTLEATTFNNNIVGDFNITVAGAALRSSVKTTNAPVDVFVLACNGPTGLSACTLPVFFDGALTRGINPKGGATPSWQLVPMNAQGTQHEWQPWDGNINTLRPAQENVVLTAQSQDFRYNAQYPQPGMWQVTPGFGNVTPSGSVLTVSETSIDVVVDNPAPSTACPILPQATSSSARLTNISTRCNVGGGVDALIAGFIIGPLDGAGTKTLLITGSGNIPGLRAVDVRLQLVRQSDDFVVGENSSWRNGSAATITPAQQAALLPSDNDAGLLISLPPSPGGYTALLTPEIAGATGIGLIGVTDMEATDSELRLINISSRCRINARPNNAAAGFIVSGAGGLNLSLSTSGGQSPVLAGALSSAMDPQFDLFELASPPTPPTRLEQVSRWQDHSSSACISDNAAILSRLGTADPAMTRSFTAGTYTIEIAPETSQNGIGLIAVEE